MSNHQMMSVAQFTAEITQVARSHKWNTNRQTELTNIATALSSDTTKHPTEVQTAPAGLRPGNKANSRFTNDILLIVNNGKAGNLTTTQMSNAITAALSTVFKPVNTAPPVVTPAGPVAHGATLTTTVGNWTYVPTSYQYVWRRNGTPIAGATASTYVTTAADTAVTITMQLAATNAAGSTTAPLSNAVSVT